MSKVIENLSNRNIIKISNDFAWAQININEVPLNIFLMLLTELDIEDNELPIFDIAILDIEKKLGKKLDRDRSALDNILQSLLNKNLRLYNDTEFITLCSEAEIILEGNILFFRIKINPLLKEEFLNLTNTFTTVNLKHILQLRGIYPKKMYMILKKMAQLKRWDPQLETLLTILNTTDSSDDYGNFKARVILPSVKKINNLKDKEMTVSFSDEVKGARKVRTLYFTMKLIEKKKNKKKTYQTAAEKKQAEENKILEEWFAQTEKEEQDNSSNENKQSDINFLN